MQAAYTYPLHYTHFILTLWTLHLNGQKMQTRLSLYCLETSEKCCHIFFRGHLYKTIFHGNPVMRKKNVWMDTSNPVCQKISNQVRNNSRNTRLRRDFSRPPAERRLKFRAPLLGGTCGAPYFSKLLHGHEDSEYVLSFEIGQRESGFYSERTDRITQPSSSVLVYRFSYELYTKMQRGAWASQEASPLSPFRTQWKGHRNLFQARYQTSPL